MEDYLGIVVDQSLRNDSLIDNLNVIAQRKAGSWVLLLVSVPEQQLSKQITMLQHGMIDVKDVCWYAHFFRDEELIVVYQDRTFHATVNPETWPQIIQHGLDNGVPVEQLDFGPRTKADAMAYFGLAPSWQ